MDQIRLSNGCYKITSENGIKDIRKNRIYSEAVVKEENIKFFVEI